MVELSDRCKLLMKLIDTKEKDNLWLELASHVLRIDSNRSGDAQFLLSKWKPEYGRTDGNAGAFVWSRPDHGPAISDDLPIPLNIKILKAMLRAELIAALHDCEHLSYVEVGYPENWQRCAIYFAEKQLSMVLRACALTNVCVFKDHSLKDRMIRGKPVRIVVERVPDSFF